MVPLAIDTFSLKLGVSGDSILGIFAKGKLPLRCISNLTLGVTNEGREAITGASQFCTRRILGLYLTSLAYADMASEHGDRKVKRESYSRYDQHDDVHH